MRKGMNYVKISMAYGFIRYVIVNETLEHNHRRKRNLVTEKIGMGLVNAMIMPITLPFMTYMDLIDIECYFRNIPIPKWYQDTFRKLD
jgi:hypothetical protein